MKTEKRSRRADNARRQRWVPLLGGRPGMSMKGGAPFFMLLLAAALALFSSVALAGIPQTLNIHGKLANATDGTAITGTNVVNFTFYDAYTGGSVIYSRNYSVRSDSTGVFTTILAGINTTFPDQYYLALHLPGDAEMSPRINLTTAPTAYRANISEDLACTGCVDGTDLADTITLDAALSVIGAYNISFNVSTLFIDTANSRVGIGTTSPNATLHVAGYINVTAGNDICIDGGNCLSDMGAGSGNVSGAGTSNTIAKFTAGSAIGNSKLTDDGTIVAVNTSDLVVNTSSGRVGIGTTGPGRLLELYGATSGSSSILLNYGAPGVALNDVYGQIQFRGSDTSGGVDNKAWGIRAKIAGIAEDTQGAVGFGFYTSTALGALTSDLYNDVSVERMRITNAGNVGIGTTGPSEKLEVSDGTNGITFAPAAATGLMNTTGGSNVTITSDGGSVIIRLGT